MSCPQLLPPFSAPVGTDLPKKWLGLGEGCLEVSLWLHLEVTQVEHHPYVFPFVFAGHAHAGGDHGLNSGFLQAVVGIQGIQSFRCVGHDDE
jgi:hypothetical protein